MSKYKIGDTVKIRDSTTLFHTRTQRYTRGRIGVVVENRPEWVVPEDEAFGKVEDGRYVPFYVVRFKQTDLWPRYSGSAKDTLETECSEMWLEPAKEAAK